MKFRCKKDGFMYGSQAQTFTAGKEYEPLEYDNDDAGYAIIDDQGNEHFIAWPGDEFFDEHFEIVEDAEEALKKESPILHAAMMEKGAK